MGFGLHTKCRLTTAGRGAQAKRTVRGYKARRGVVERTHWWLNRYRKMLVSFEKTEESHVALLTLAAAMICWRQTIIIYG